ncbi:Ubiquinone/menaquinone biosynthesis C-methylase UbiE [Seinonella peptonophila]|uniref:Ubiquinone/menaquinone biosynthesis C-methylase UbiE n=1 Tax=Seinonella peptonophila TaxID=112248 RepID=A0A1M5B255_9BACL|nr:class I SAM-dependent methyltransferase [Seinonella peptonophila]SHF36594.1 Ubiquinone/menaquinone biosynthesis C-methylase UbiE [Seinonella peptonophila]
MDKKVQVQKFDKQAKKYEKMQKNDPIAKFRKRIFPEAEGRVLEVAIGAGLNLPFYKNVTELVGIDFSLEMLRVAKQASLQYSFPIKLNQADVETAEFEANSFDTIVSSLSFCTYENPIHVMNQFSKWCKPNGKILMLEHGKSTNRMLSILQKAIDPLAFKMIGCHQDREILHYVNSSNLEVLNVNRSIAGLLYFIWARPIGQ